MGYCPLISQQAFHISALVYNQAHTHSRWFVNSSHIFSMPSLQKNQVPRNNLRNSGVLLDNVTNHLK